MKVLKIDPNAQVPKRTTKRAAGADVFSCENIVIPANDRKLVNLGLKFVFDPKESIYVRLAPRSGLSLKKKIDVGAGVIDADYTGVVKVILINSSDTPFEVKIGDRIAQAIIEVIKMDQWEETKSVPESTDRDPSGFGSSGV